MIFQKGYFKGYCEYVACQKCKETFKVNEIYTNKEGLFVCKNCYMKGVSNE